MLVALNGIMEKNQQFNYFFVDWILAPIWVKGIWFSSKKIYDKWDFEFIKSLFKDVTYHDTCKYVHKPISNRAVLYRLWEFFWEELVEIYDISRDNIIFRYMHKNWFDKMFCLYDHLKWDKPWKRFLVPKMFSESDEYIYNLI
jgi:flagellar biosynthesis protein FlhB